MTEKPRKFSDTARALLTAAAARDDHLIQPPQLPAAAARQAMRSLLNAGLAEEVSAVVDDGDGDGCPSATRSAAVTIVAGADSDGTWAQEQPLAADALTGRGRDLIQTPPAARSWPGRRRNL